MKQPVSPATSKTFNCAKFSKQWPCECGAGTKETCFLLPESIDAPPSATRRIDALKDDQIQHVYPTFGREHVTDQRDNCWCQPRTELVEGGAIIIHEAEQ